MGNTSNQSHDCKGSAVAHAKTCRVLRAKGPLGQSHHEADRAHGLVFPLVLHGKGWPGRELRLVVDCTKLNKCMLCPTHTFPSSTEVICCRQNGGFLVLRTFLQTPIEPLQDPCVSLTEPAKPLQQGSEGGHAGVRQVFVSATLQHLLM